MAPTCPMAPTEPATPSARTPLIAGALRCHAGTFVRRSSQKGSSRSSAASQQREGVDVDGFPIAMGAPVLPETRCGRQWRGASHSARWDCGDLVPPIMPGPRISAGPSRAAAANPRSRAMTSLMNTFFFLFFSFLFFCRVLRQDLGCLEKMAKNRHATPPVHGLTYTS